MKKFLLIAFTCLIPSAHAVDYVKCEAIRSVLVRNEIQKRNVVEGAERPFKQKKLKERFPDLVENVNGYVFCIDRSTRKEISECDDFRNSILSVQSDGRTRLFEDEFQEYIKPKLKSYEERETRASKDWVKNDCF